MTTSQNVFSVYNRRIVTFVNPLEMQGIEAKCRALRGYRDAPYHWKEIVLLIALAVFWYLGGWDVLARVVEVLDQWFPDAVLAVRLWVTAVQNVVPPSIFYIFLSQFGR